MAVKSFIIKAPVDLKCEIRNKVGWPRPNIMKRNKIRHLSTLLARVETTFSHTTLHPKGRLPALSIKYIGSDILIKSLKRKT